VDGSTTWDCFRPDCSSIARCDLHHCDRTGFLKAALRPGEKKKTWPGVLAFVISLGKPGGVESGSSRIGSAKRHRLREATPPPRFHEPPIKPHDPVGIAAPTLYAGGGGQRLEPGGCAPSDPTGFASVINPTTPVRGRQRLDEWEEADALASTTEPALPSGCLRRRIAKPPFAHKNGVSRMPRDSGWNSFSGLGGFSQGASGGGVGDHVHLLVG